MMCFRQQGSPAWLFCLLLALCPGRYRGLSVRFPSEEPVYVIPGESLVLEARLEQGGGEQVATVTWEREAEGRSPGKVKVAELPGVAPDARVSTEQQGATLRLSGFRPEDRGVYTLTVTSRAGAKSSAARTVREYEAIHHVSVGINVSHAVLQCGEAWGSEPRFSWLHEAGAVPPETGRVSPDGTRLHLAAPPCGHYTCIVSNKLGRSSATYSAEPCGRKGSGTAVGVAFLVILLICGGFLGFLLWRRHRKLGNRAERLQEPYEP
ncbi:uncharacterized protein si:dkeyp-97a10.2 [Conger conger]|uniref:uncharacterized protein si:dkeyp-97a10.2 n=1 Tax=Conger conger TaxID=82655 RepID=UPI002A59C225|nr:uncharacterized protein si:dkeyp-97a10.2 [Conger conger]XP_061118379.1 uncharacterized protein si:dkeyp-97a10.2 [Conger conger]